MKARTWILTAAVALLLCNAYAAEEAPKPVTFAQAVVNKAIGFMPQEIRTKLTVVEKEIANSAKPAAKPACYFVDKEEGTGPAALTDQFRSTRKKITEKATYTALAPYLGKLAGTVIDLAQPYHTSETALKGKEHAAFEKTLDAEAAKLKAEFDGSQKVTNPSEYAIKIAGKANELLTKLDPADAAANSETHTAVLNLAANSVADCWWTLLVAEKPTSASASDAADSSSAAPTEGGYIGNLNSLKFHSPTCRFLPAEKNRVYFKTREEAVNQGYVACKVCKP